jgi:hypothetical protein
LKYVPAASVGMISTIKRADSLVNPEKTRIKIRIFLMLADLLSIRDCKIPHFFQSRGCGISKAAIPRDPAGKRD